MWELKEDDVKVLRNSFLLLAGSAALFLLGFKSCQHFAGAPPSPDTFTDVVWALAGSIIGFVLVVAGALYGAMTLFLFLIVFFKVVPLFFMLGVSKLFDLFRIGRFRYIIIAFFLLVSGLFLILMNFYDGEINGAFFRNTYNHCRHWISGQVN
jgi:hypothetical protein